MYSRFVQLNCIWFPNPFCIWFPNPFSANKSKQSGARFKFKAGTQFSRPEGEFWDKFVRDEKSHSTQPEISATTTDSVAHAFTGTAYDILIDWEAYKAAIKSSDPEDRIFH